MVIMNVYMYKADLYCEDCGKKLREDLYHDLRPDEFYYDSEDFPTGPYPNGGGEADSPWHCGAGDDCVNAEWCPTHGEQGGHKIGVFLENPLTQDGLDYVKQCCKDSLAGSGGCVSLDIWAPFYRISLEDDDDLPRGE